MKKIVSLMLSLLLIAGMIMVPVAAVEEASLDANLVTRFDFDGADAVAQRTDTATGGSTTEMIQVNTGWNTNTTVTDGVAAITGNSGITSAMQNTDIATNATGEFTFYMNFKMHVDETNANSGRTHDLMNLRAGTTVSTNRMRIYATGWNTTAHTADLYIYTPNQTTKIGTINYSCDAADNDIYYRLAWTMQYDEVNAVWNHYYYLSSNNGASYTANTTAVTSADSETFFNDLQYLYLGCLNSSLKASITYVNDFRIYNKAISLDELKTIDSLATAPDTDTVEPDVKATLVTRFDFDGADAVAQRTDTATGGSTTEMIQVNTGWNTNTTVADGVAAITGNSGITSAMQNTDIATNATGEFTFYMNFKMHVDEANANSGRTHDLMNLRAGTTVSTNRMRIYATGWDTTAHTADLYIYTPNQTTKIGTINYSCDAAANNTYYRLAWTMQYDATNAVWNHYYYLSSDNGASYTANVTAVTSADSETFFSDLQYLYLGCLNSSLKASITYLNDFRIYNKALTEDELTEIDVVETGAIYHGIQIAEGDGTFDVRFVGSIDSLNYGLVGFELTATDGTENYKWDENAKHVYESLIGKDENDNRREYTSTALRGAGSYLFAKEITLIPATGTVTFTVKTYACALGSDVRTYGTAYTVTFTNGAYVSSAVVAD